MLAVLVWQRLVVKSLKPSPCIINCDVHVQHVLVALLKLAACLHCIMTWTQFLPKAYCVCAHMSENSQLDHFFKQPNNLLL